MRKIVIHPSWEEALREEFEKPYFGDLSRFVHNEVATGQVIYPHPRDIFAAFDRTPFDRVRVVILGQDPYHGPGQAHGLAFSVRAGVRRPPSLVNIYKEIQHEKTLGLLPESTGEAGDGDLSRWADQGVFLLNTTLTVRSGQPMSHAGIGWELFTDAVISTLSTQRSGLIFLLWGSHAQKKSHLIDTSRHHILTAPHPSPLSAHRGFLGCGHFAGANSLLVRAGETPIVW